MACIKTSICTLYCMPNVINDGILNSKELYFWISPLLSMTCWCFSFVRWSFKHEIHDKDTAHFLCLVEDWDYVKGLFHQFQDNKHIFPGTIRHGRKYALMHHMKEITVSGDAIIRHVSECFLNRYRIKTCVKIFDVCKKKATDVKMLDISVKTGVITYIWTLVHMSSGPLSVVNSFVPGRCGCNIELAIFKHISKTGILDIISEIAIMWKPQGLISDGSWQVHVMTWCRQTTNQYLN